MTTAVPLLAASPIDRVVSWSAAGIPRRGRVVTVHQGRRGLLHVGVRLDPQCGGDLVTLSVTRAGLDAAMHDPTRGARLHSQAPVDLHAARLLALTILGGGEPRLPVSRQLTLLAAAVLDLAAADRAATE